MPSIVGMGHDFYRIKCGVDENHGGKHAELYLGIFDFIGSCFCGLYGTHERCDECSTGQRRRGDFTVYYHGRCHGIMDGIDGNCPEGRHHRQDDQRHQPLFEFYVSRNSPKSPGKGIHSHQSHSQYTGTWLGVYTGGSESHGSTGKSGGRAGEYRI